MDLGLALLCKQLLLYYTLKSMYALQICYIHMKNHQFLWGKYKMENGNPMIFTGKSCLHLFPHKGYWIFTNMYTLDSEINVPPGITVAPPLKNFYITILILFYINLGIAVIFKFFLSSKIFKN